MRVTTAQLLVFALLYAAYALSLVVKRNYAFWKEEAAAEGLASAAALGSLGALYESASGAAKVGGAVLVDLLPPAAVLAASLAGQGAACLLALLALQRGAPSLALARGAWGLNGAVAAFAWPALARVFMAWFPRPEDRGLWYGILGTCQNAGAAVAPLLTQAAAGAFGWRARLALPGALALLFSAVVLGALRDAPPPAAAAAKGEGGGREREGAAALAAEAPPPPPAARPAAGQRSSSSSSSSSSSRQRLAVARGSSAAPSPGAPLGAAAALAPAPAPAPAPAHTFASLMLLLLASRQQWLLSANYFFNSFVRNGVTTYVSSLLVAHLGHAPAVAAAANFAFELGGALGGLASGALSDSAFGGRRGPVMLLFGLALVPLPLALPLLRGAGLGAVAAAYFALGLAAFPPHVLNGLLSRELAPRAVQSSAGGWTKCWGQAGASAADGLVPALVAAVGWGGAARALAGAAALSALAVAPLWGALAVAEEGAPAPAPAHKAPAGARAAR